ncbi:Methylsterol monooxygenase [Sphaceloma murrayae]|uniref:Methylsterol monooxygenase n=1 Tax=Sphaceloma murrayae TaxID=2082308 RepID=A0A2K1QQE4_9PEZI|nr:Methylsterol monooxygenase [Sphaceloma murrayae]
MNMEYELPPLPEYKLRPLEPLVPGLPDTWLQAILLIVAYWAVSGFFYLIDEMDWFPQYRLHTPEEITKRNRVSKWEVFRDVIYQQIIQTAFALLLGVLDPPAMTGKENYDIAVWAQRLRMAQHAIPSVLAMVGLDSRGIAQKVEGTYPTLSSVLAGGVYNEYRYDQTSGCSGALVPGFADWEVLAAKAIYHLGVPALQFAAAVTFIDTWQYFWHRAMHMNKWLYTKFHSRHHRLYVPYAFGALYNTLAEGFVLDTLGAGLAYLVTGMTCRQAMVLFTGSTIKTVDDHCGYALPFDPLQHLTSNNAAYHDIHHQSWGIKSNFSQPFFTFWDRLLNTKFKGDTSLRYERDRLAMARRDEMAKKDAVKVEEPVAQSVELAPPFEGEDAGESTGGEGTTSEGRVLRRSPRKRSAPAPAQNNTSFVAPIKELRSRMQSSVHGRASGVMMESSH